MTIRSIRPASPETWDRLVQADPRATFFHTRTWYEWAARHQPLRLSPKLLTLESGARVLLPLAHFSTLKGLFKQYVSSPLGTYGGFVSETDISAPERKALAGLLDRFTSIELRCNPFSPLLRDYPGFPRDDVTQVIDLDIPREELLSAMNREQIPRKVRQAEKHGLRLARLTPKDSACYPALYADCRTRWNTSGSTYSAPMLEDLFRLPGCEGWGVFTPDNRLICAGPFLVHGRHVVSWLALAATNALAMKPYEFLYVNLIDHYRERGFKWFDLNPSGGHEGVAHFKTGLGAQPWPSPIISRQHPLIKLLIRLHRIPA